MRYLCYCCLSPFNVSPAVLAPFEDSSRTEYSLLSLRTRTPRSSLNNVLWLEYIK